MKIGIDIHGVADATPYLFRLLSMAQGLNDEIHIVTGGQLTPKYLKYVNALGINYDKIFSISDHLLESDTPVRWSDAENPWFDAELWNKAKADYCEKHDIDFMLDDTERYAKYFKNIKTEFILFKKID